MHIDDSYDMSRTHGRAQSLRPTGILAVRSVIDGEMPSKFVGMNDRRMFKTGVQTTAFDHDNQQAYEGK